MPKDASAGKTAGINFARTAKKIPAGRETLLRKEIARSRPGMLPVFHVGTVARWNVAVKDTAIVFNSNAKRTTIPDEHHVRKLYERHQNAILIETKFGVPGTPYA